MIRLRLLLNSSHRFKLRNFRFLIYSRQNRFLRPPLVKAPQRKGIIKRLRIKTPKKPNSARRLVIKTRLSTIRYVVAHLPGQGNNLRRYSKVLVSGQGPADLPGVNYTAIRGKFDFSGCFFKTKRRSIYGVFKPLELKYYVRKKLRK